MKMDEGSHEKVCKSPTLKVSTDEPVGRVMFC